MDNPHPEYYRRTARSHLRMAQRYAEELRASLAHPQDNTCEQIWRVAVMIAHYRGLYSRYFQMWRDELRLRESA